MWVEQCIAIPENSEGTGPIDAHWDAKILEGFDQACVSKVGLAAASAKIQRLVKWTGSVSTPLQFEEAARVNSFRATESVCNFL